MFKRRFWGLLFLGAVLGTGLYDWILQSGIYYEFRSFDHYNPGQVQDAPNKPTPLKPFKKQEENSLEFFALGCAGSGNLGQKMVSQSMAKIAGESKPAFILYLGDNFYGRGVDSVNDPKWQSLFEQIYDARSLDMPFYAVLGNHDYHKNPDAQIEYAKTNPRWRMPARYYHFENFLENGTQIDFFALDTMMLHSRKNKEQLAWLEEKLQSSKAAWKIVYGHHPVYSGAYTYPKQTQKMRAMLEPIFIRHKVDMYLSAHNHSIEVLEKISGVTYAVSGGGSRPRDVRWTDQTLFAYADVGFIKFRILEQAMEVQVIGKNGAVLFSDRIEK